MDTHGPGSKMRRRHLMPFLAILMSGLLLSLWISAVSAQNENIANIDSQAVSQSSYQVEPDPDLLLSTSSQSPTETTQLAPEALPFGLTIAKSRLPLTFTVGSNNRYILNVSRSTTGTITSTIAVEDDLPPGMTWTPPTTAGNWDCTAGSGSTTTKVSCFYASAIGVNTLSLDPINIIVNVSKNVADVVTNTATLLYGGQTSTDFSKTPIRSADLVIKKAQYPSSVPAELTPITYTIAITNNGPTTATNVLVTDTLPTDLNTYQEVSIVPSGTGTFNPATNQWSIFSLSKNEVATLTLKTYPLVGTSGHQIVNTAKISSSTFDYDTSNNTSSASFVVGGMKIEKKVSTPTTYAGAPFDYSIVVTNTSNSYIGATVKDNFTTTLDIIDCYYYDISGVKNNCYLSGENLNYFIYVPPHYPYTIHITARGNEGIGSIPRTITDTATVTWGSPSFTLTSNPVEIVISPGGYVQVGKTSGQTSVSPGERVTYTVSISNTGSLNIAAGSMQFVDNFLTNLDYVSINKNGLTMNELIQSGNNRSWSFPGKTLAPGEKMTFYVSANVPNGSRGFAINQATVSGNDIAGHSNTSQVQTSDEIVVVAAGTMDITKSVTPEQAQVGGTLTFKVVLENVGDVQAKNIVVNDYLQKYLDLSSATTSRGTAYLDTANRQVEVDISSMNPGEKATIVITAKVNSTVTAARTLRNRAYIKFSGASEFSSKNVAFRVLPSGTLPGTGFYGLASTAAFLPLSSGLVALSALLGLAALLLLSYSLFVHIRRPLSAGKFSRTGLGLLLIAILCGVGAFLSAPREQVAAQLSMLSGQKPPVATSLPILPVSTNPPVETVEIFPVEENDSTSEPVELLPVRPTPETPSTEEPPQPTPTLTDGEIDISHLLPTPTPSTLPDYPIPTPPALVTVGPDGGAPDSSPVQRIEIPRLGLNTIVKFVPFNGETWLISGLKQEIAWMGETSWPGLGGNTALAGHVDLVTGAKGPFWNLKDLQAGDEVVVYTTQKVYTYRVREQEVVDDTDMSVIQPTTKPQLTLITCTGWDTEVRTYLKRLIVFADLVRVGTSVSFSN